MTTFVQLKCPHCGDYYCVLKENKYETHTCTKCDTEVVPEIVVPVGTPHIASGAGSMNKNLSREFADSVLNPIKSLS